MSYFRTTRAVRSEFAAHPRRALVITTVSHETRAVNAQLQDRETVTSENGMPYYVGRFADPSGDWHIVHAVTLPGNSPTAATVTKAHAEFGRFDVQFFVGVAGSLKKDVPIGSVVAGKFVYNAHGAKVQGEDHLSRHNAHPADAALIKAAQFLISDGDWPQLIKPPSVPYFLPRINTPAHSPQRPSLPQLLPVNR